VWIAFKGKGSKKEFHEGFLGLIETAEVAYAIKS
jgi:hypothetical protein